MLFQNFEKNFLLNSTPQKAPSEKKKKESFKKLIGGAIGVSMQLIVWKSLSHLIHLHRILGVLLLLFLVYDAHATYSKLYFTLCDTCFTLTVGLSTKVCFFSFFFIFRGEGIQKCWHHTCMIFKLNGVDNVGIKRLTSYLFYSSAERWIPALFLSIY